MITDMFYLIVWNVLSDPKAKFHGETSVSEIVTWSLSVLELYSSTTIQSHNTPESTLVHFWNMWTFFLLTGITIKPKTQDQKGQILQNCVSACRKIWHLKMESHHQDSQNDPPPFKKWWVTETSLAIQVINCYSVFCTFNISIIKISYTSRRQLDERFDLNLERFVTCKQVSYII